MKPTEFFNEWSSRDRELAKALMLHDRSQCRCGQDANESWNPDSTTEYEAVDHQCRACAILDEANEGPSTEKGIHWTVVKRDTSQAGRTVARESQEQ